MTHEAVNSLDGDGKLQSLDARALHSLLWPPLNMQARRGALEVGWKYSGRSTQIYMLPCIMHFTQYSMLRSQRGASELSSTLLLGMYRVDLKSLKTSVCRTGIAWVRIGLDFILKGLFDVKISTGLISGKFPSGFQAASVNLEKPKGFRNLVPWETTSFLVPDSYRW